MLKQSTFFRVSCVPKQQMHWNCQSVLCMDEFLWDKMVKGSRCRIPRKGVRRRSIPAAWREF